MALSVLAVILGLTLLFYSADRFVEGAAATAKYFGMPPLLIGMVVVGFGTSVPEMVVSAISAAQGNAGIALGNAYGSNITNIALILGLTAVISPITVNSQVLRKELPILTIISVMAIFQLWDGELSRTDASILMVVFGGLMAWSITQGLKQKEDALGKEVKNAIDVHSASIGKSLANLGLGLALLIASSRILVWGAVKIAQDLGVSELIIGLTIVALGTSLPELASSVFAARKGEHDIALGNVLGSNLFNTLAVVGIAGLIHPLKTGPEVISRDLPFMIALTLSLFIIGYGFYGPGRINRFEGAALLTGYIGYTVYLMLTAVG